MNLPNFIKQIQGALSGGANNISSFTHNLLNPQPTKSPMEIAMEQAQAQGQKNRQALQQDYTNQQKPYNAMTQQLDKMQEQIQPAVTQANTNADLIHRYLAGDYSEPGSYNNMMDTGVGVPQLNQVVPGQITQQQTPQAYIPQFQTPQADIAPTAQQGQALTPGMIRQGLPMNRFQQGGQG